MVARHIVFAICGKTLLEQCTKYWHSSGNETCMVQLNGQGNGITIYIIFLIDGLDNAEKFGLWWDIRKCATPHDLGIWCLIKQNHDLEISPRDKWYHSKLWCPIIDALLSYQSLRKFPKTCALDGITTTKQMWRRHLKSGQGEHQINDFNINVTWIHPIPYEPRPNSYAPIHSSFNKLGRLHKRSRDILEKYIWRKMYIGSANICTWSLEPSRAFGPSSPTDMSHLLDQRKQLGFD